MVANKLMCGDTVVPVAHHRGEADVVEEVCGRTVINQQKPVINDHVQHRQQSPHKQPQKQRAGALMLPSSCLDGSITRVGPGQHPQYTGALYGGEAVGVSSQQHSISQMSPNSCSISRCGTAEVFIHRCCGRAQTYGHQSDVFNALKPWFVMLTFETKILRSD